MGQPLRQVTATHPVTTTVSKELLLVRSPSTNSAAAVCSIDAGGNIQNTKLPAETMFSKRRSGTISEFSGPLGRLIVKKEVQNSKFRKGEESTSVNTNHSESITWIFIPSFLSYAFDYRYLNTHGYAERTLRTYPILPLDHPIWHMCFRGDLAGIQKLLGDRQISPFSVDEDGDTLLHHSARISKAELCKFLFKIGFTGEETNNSNELVTPSSNHCISYFPKAKQRFKDYETTYEVISSHVCISDSRFFNAILFSGEPCYTLPPDMFAKVVYGCYTKYNINASKYSPLAVVAKAFVYSPQNLRYRWKSTIRHLISLEADLHQGFFKDEKTTILDDLIGKLEDPFRSRSIGQAWLVVLTEFGIDVSKYLQTEYQLHFDPSTARPMLRKNYESYHRPRYLIISIEPLSVSWDWYIDPEGQAYDVLEEFKYFGGFAFAFEPWHDYFRPHWPATYYRWQWSRDERDFGWSHQNDFLLLHHADARFKRRCERKVMKLAKAQGIFHQGPKMPGAWID